MKNCKLGRWASLHISAIRLGKHGVHDAECRILSCHRDRPASPCILWAVWLMENG
ncbi:hypothetical protein BDV32DRAFT_129663 [Aspergillus pseudonomiae]|nr:hypothetical protein BDV32DRAFT_129663 [Aspergillus pseudonomiae]